MLKIWFRHRLIRIVLIFNSCPLAFHQLCSVVTRDFQFQEEGGVLVFQES